MVSELVGGKVKPIVYIDDEPMLCRVFQRLLSSVGAEVVTFTDPELAIAYLHEHEAAAIICDYRMPGTTGLALLERIPPGMPFFLVSGELAIPLAEENPRITGIIAKPFRAELMLATVARYLPVADPPGV